VYILLICSTSR